MGKSSIREICKIVGCGFGFPGWPDKFGEALSCFVDENNVSKIKTLSLFSGGGGLDIGFHDAGFEIIESVELESKFYKTLVANSGQGKKFASSNPKNLDIRDYSADGLEDIEFIIGGPPCQTFSAAGRRTGGVKGLDDSRGMLFKEYVRIIKKLNPVGFLFENVYGLVGAQHGIAWNVIRRAFSEIGYNLFYRVLDAADYGVPQHRERLIVVGLRNLCEFKFPRPLFGPDSVDKEPFYNAGCAVSGFELSDEEKKEGLTGMYGYLLDGIPPGLNYSFYTEKMGYPEPVFEWRSRFSDFLYKADPEQPVRTIKAQGGKYTGPFHWNNRNFSVSEFKRLQTFPDDYEICGSRNVAVHQIGNSVPPQFARIIAIAIRMQVFDCGFPFIMDLLDEDEELSFKKNKREMTEIYREKARDAIEKLKFKK